MLDPESEADDAQPRVRRDAPGKRFSLASVAGARPSTGTLGMGPEPTTERSSAPAPRAQELPRYKRSRFWRFFVDAGYAWDMFYVIAIAVGGVAALFVAVFTLDIVALALALIALPAAFIMWCIAKAVRDAARDG